MTNLVDDLRQATDAVARLGSSSADYEALPDAAVVAGQKQLAAARRLLETRSAWMAATIARRSRPERGHSGLAAQQGTAPGLIDSLTCPTDWLPKTV